MSIEKTLATRIKLRYDLYDNWISNDPVLLAGEIALAAVSTKQEGMVNTVPSVLIKCGDGTHKYSELEYVYARAADVVDAAKSESALTTFVTNVITNSGIATNDALTALAGRVSTNETAITTLNGDATTAGSVAKSIADAIAALDLANTYDAKGAAGQALTDAKAYTDEKDAAMDARVDVLEAAIAADGAVDTKISNAINALDVVDTAVDGKYVSAVNEVDGKVVITRADLPDYSETYDAKGAAATALADAKAYADGLASNYDAAGSAAAVQTKLNEEVARATAAEAQALTDAKAYADGLASNYDASGSAAAVQAKLDEEVARAKAAEEANAAAAKAADDKAVAAQGEVDALETLVGTLPEGTDVTTVVAYIDAKTANIASDETVGAIADRVTAIEGDYLVEADKTELSDAIAAEKTRAEGVEAGLQTAIDAINNETTGVLAQAKTYADGKDTAIAEAKKAGTDAQADVDALAAAVGTVAEGKTVVEMIADAQTAATYDDTQIKADVAANTSAIELLTNGVSADEVDGVNDLIQYVKEHGTEVTGMKSDISANTDAIAAEKSRAEGVESGLDTRLQAVEAAVGESGSVASDIATAKQEAIDSAVATAATDATTKANAAETNAKEYSDGLNTAMDERMTVVEGKAHEHSNKDLLDTYTQTEDDLADAVAKKHEHTNKTLLDGIEEANITAWNAKVDAITASETSGLKATRTDNTVAIEIDDSVVFILDCGDSTDA